MTMLNEFHYIRPLSIAEAVTQLSADSGASLLAGGTDLVPNLRRGLVKPSALIDLTWIESISQVQWHEQQLTIGAGVTLAQLAADVTIAERFPALVETLLLVAGPTHRAVATLGGNLCQDTRCIFYNQSEWWRKGNDYCLKYQGQTCHVITKSDRCYATYHGDVAPLLMVLGARAEVSGPEGTRQLPLAQLYVEDGSTHLTLGAGEFLSAVVLDWDSSWVSGYEKARVRDAVDFPLAGIAVALRRQGECLQDLRLAVTGTNSMPLNVDLSHLQGKPWDDAAAESLAVAIRKAVNVLRTTVTGPKYRRRVAMAMARRLVSTLWQQAGC